MAEVIDLHKEGLWKILRGESTLPEAMIFLGASQANADFMIEKIKEKDIHDSFNYFSVGLQLKRVAYDKLLDAKEIDGDKIFNLGCSKIDDGNARKGDLGFQGKNTLIFQGEWKMT